MVKVLQTKPGDHNHATQWQNKASRCHCGPTSSPLHQLMDPHHSLCVCVWELLKVYAHSAGSKLHSCNVWKVSVKLLLFSTSSAHIHNPSLCLQRSQNTTVAGGEGAQKLQYCCSSAGIHQCIHYAASEPKVPPVGRTTTLPIKNT